MILTLRTDKPEAEIGLFDKETQSAYVVWPAHRQLAETLHTKIADMLESQNLVLSDLSGLVVYKGPGSFTGLRIGLSVANALAASYDLPIAATSGDDWLTSGIKMITAESAGELALPQYGSAPHITAPKK